MAYKISWLVDRRILYVYQEGVVTLDELTALVEEQIAFTNHGIAPVYVINDSTRLKKIAFGLSDIKKLITFPQNPKAGWHLLVTPDRVKQLLASVANQMLGVANRQFATVEEAIYFLANLDDSLGTIPKPNAEQQTLLQVYK